jgi:molybdopterin-guanine dinucleotide biosynthesis protein A
MGRDKARLKLGGRTLLSRIRQAANDTGMSVKLIRRDNVPRCGPLGGVYTALTRTRMNQVIFLACDMPLISPEAIYWLLEKAAAQIRSNNKRGRSGSPKNAFISGKEGAGFPFLLRKSALKVVAEQIELGKLSLQQLARRLGAVALRPPPSMRTQLVNLNTPADWARLTGAALDKPARTAGAKRIRIGNSNRRSASSRS